MTDYDHPPWFHKLCLKVVDRNEEYPCPQLLNYLDSIARQHPAMALGKREAITKEVRAYLSQCATEPTRRKQSVKATKALEACAECPAIWSKPYKAWAQFLRDRNLEAPSENTWRKLKKERISN